MEIPRSLLDRLTREINALSSAGQQLVLNAIANSEWGTVADLRAIMCEVMEAVCGEITDLAAARTAEFYDDVREIAVGSTFGATAESKRNPAATDGAVRALVQSVADTGQTAMFARDLADRVDYEAKAASENCVSSNARKDPLKPKYARVPSGAETCSFCLMIASFGFHYTDPTGHNHANCDCRAVPGFDGVSVAGYEPDDMYRRYTSCLEAIGGRDGLRADWDALPSAERERLVAKSGGKGSKAFESYLSRRVEKEIATRDPKWMRDGSPGSITKERGAKPNSDERAVAGVLSGLGFETEFVAESKEKFVKSPDARLNGSLWEFTIPTAFNEKTVKNQFKKSLGKGTRKLLISNYANRADAADVVKGIRRILDSEEFAEIDEVLFVGFDGMLVRLKR